MSTSVQEGRVWPCKLGWCVFLKSSVICVTGRSLNNWFCASVVLHIWRFYNSIMSNALMQQFVAGLKSRNAETRSKAARDLYHYVSKKLIRLVFITRVVIKAVSSKRAVCHRSRQSFGRFLWKSWLHLWTISTIIYLKWFQDLMWMRRKEEYWQLVSDGVNGIYMG